MTQQKITVRKTPNCAHLSARSGPPVERLVLRCPASMCPLIAPDGSPWTGKYDSPCPGHDDLDNRGCPWWGMTCKGGHMQAQVDEAEINGGYAPVVGPRKPKRMKGSPRKYNCPKAGECRWQEQAEKAGLPLCPPRSALARGLDPRICLF